MALTRSCLKRPLLINTTRLVPRSGTLVPRSETFHCETFHESGAKIVSKALCGEGCRDQDGHVADPLPLAFEREFFIDNLLVRIH